MTNCKLLYMTSRDFLRVFGKYELEKLKEFTEKVDLEEIETRVRNNWMHRKRLNKRIHEAVVDDTNRENRMRPWQEKGHSKKHNLPDLVLEDKRIKVIEVRVTKAILTDPEEYNRDLNEKEKQGLLKAMLEKERLAAEKQKKDQEELESSVGRMTSRLESKSMKNTKGGHETFNIQPQPSKKESTVRLRPSGVATTMVDTTHSDKIELRPKLLKNDTLNSEQK